MIYWVLFGGVVRGVCFVLLAMEGFLYETLRGFMISGRMGLTGVEDHPR